ncbi:MAG: hypothetical protein QOE90_2019 [Thermoplasmata archaeon]|jgi:hypothetical protein|nr:hypothetical protein [Thermoplasmata archaeon]
MPPKTFKPIAEKPVRAIQPPTRTAPPKTFSPTLRGEFVKRLEDPRALKPFIDRPAKLASHATIAMDGRKQPLVLVLARTQSGDPIPGVRVRLLQGSELRDETTTDKRGAALLLFPAMSGTKMADMQTPATPTDGRVEILQKGRSPITKHVAIPMGKQHQVMELTLEAPTEIPIDSAPSTGIASNNLGNPLTDNPLDRLPADFTTDLCQDLTKLLGPANDPILGQMGGDDQDFRKRRVPLVKRLVIPRIGESVNGKPPRRYLVRVRQEWNFLGYTLGELTQVEPLDPGSILQQTTQAAEKLVSNATRSVDELVSRATDSVVNGLHSAGSVDAVTELATSVRTTAIAGGGGFFLPPFAFGGGGADAKVTATATSHSRVDTSLDVNSSMHAAKTLVNQATRLVQSTQRDLTNAVTSTLGKVSPLLSRVTNLIRWTMYENYMVCTHVEDVLEVESEVIADLTQQGQAYLFTDEQIVDLRRVFEPNLLERRLAPHFDSLAAAVDVRRGANLPIVAVDVTLDYQVGLGGATVDVAVGEGTTSFVLRPGTTRATQTLRLNVPANANDITGAQLDLSLSTPQSIFGPIAIPNSAQVNRVTLGFVTASGYRRTLTIPLGSTLSASGQPGTASATPAFSVPPPVVLTDADPLLVHVNHNKTYYFGLLCQAALVEPALRDDMPQFDAFNGDHPIWRLPIVGFEGNRALIVKEADATDAEVKTLLADPGAATLIQIAAPGAYAEALQGLLKLAVDLEKIHPALLPPPAPVMPPLAIVDMTGKTIPVLGGNGMGGTPTPTPTPLPLPTP